VTDTAGIYARISVDRQGRREGVEAQEKWGRAYAAQHWPGCRIRVFADNSVSAASDAERLGYEELRAAVRAGEITHLWCIEQSRLERREAQWFELAAELDDAGITELHTNRDGIVRVRDEVAGIKAVLNAGEVRKLKRRVNDKLDELAAQGRPAGGAYFGYKRTEDVGGGKTLEIVPEQAEAIRWAADAVLSGWSLTNISTELRRRGHRGVLGGQLGTSAVRTLLMSPTVAGLRVHRKVIVGRGNWKPILAEDIWQAVRSKLSGTRTVTCANGQNFTVTEAALSSKTVRKYILTGGLARCGVCGAALVGCMKHFVQRRKASRPYLMCSRTAGGRACVGIQLEPTEEHVADRLFAELDKPEFLEAVSSDDHARRRDQLTRALAGIDAQRTELAGMWAGGGMSTVEWQAARDGLDQREQALRAELVAIPPSVERIDITGARQAWPAMTLDEKRAFVLMFIEKVTIHRAVPGRAFDPDRIEITWRSL
jgi:site-specific DNA recombinase